jgi:hypothetical protein
MLAGNRRGGDIARGYPKHPPIAEWESAFLGFLAEVIGVSPYSKTKKKPTLSDRLPIKLVDLLLN